MGTDIHMFMEIYRNNRWVHKPTKSLPENRNYEFFKLLVGNIRSDRENESTPLFTLSPLPKGIPSDISECISYEISDWRKDVHSFSYFSLTELLKEIVNVETSDVLTQFTKNNFEQLIDELSDCSENISSDDIRIVFWFDS